MLKALMPVSVYCVGVVAGTETFSLSRYANMAVITAGVALASYGELNFNWLGVFIQLGAVAVEAIRLVLIELLLNRANLNLNSNPMLSMYYISPCCLLCLTVPFFAVEYDALVSPIATWVWDSRVFLGNAAIAMALNLAVYLLIGKTSALTMNVASVLKDWVCITVSNFFFFEPTTGLQLVGYGIGVLAVSYYNYSKYKVRRLAGTKAQDQRRGLSCRNECCGGSAGEAQKAGSGAQGGRRQSGRWMSGGLRGERCTSTRIQSACQYARRWRSRVSEHKLGRGKRIEGLALAKPVNSSFPARRGLHGQ
jgi:hypothetical protein